MILSHKYKYIFIKPIKVAGTSVEVALAKHCGKNDVITPITTYSQESDEAAYVQPVRNNEGFYNHMTPEEIKDKVGEEIWNSYYKFTIIRNPWDQVVSRFWYRQKNREKISVAKSIGVKNIYENIFNPKAYRFVSEKLFPNTKKTDINDRFKDFLDNYEKKWMNSRFYFDEQGEPVCDHYMYFENLEQDYKKVCAHLGIPFETLPRLKSKQRKSKRHYSTYFDEVSGQMVRNLFHREIELWNYTFEKE